jgi:fatty-acyl-CoA synthase
VENAIKQIESQLLVLLRTFLSESDGGHAASAVSLHAVIDKELGIGSIEKAELINRIEKHFHVQLSEKTLIEAVTVADLAEAIAKAEPPKQLFSEKMILEMAVSGVDPTRAESLVDVLLQYAEKEPDRPHIFLQDDSGKEELITYGQLFEASKKVASSLQKQGLYSNDTVAILLPTGMDFLAAFFGVLMMGAVPVPIYPPLHPDQIESYIKREAGILNNAEVKALITFDRVENKLGEILETFISSLKCVTTVAKLSAASDGNLLMQKNRSAMIQYTSGSTGNPKGVLLSHENLLANIRAYGEAVGVKPTDVAISWLPLYHDMGLIGLWLGSLYYGIPLVLMSPLTFLARPEKWLWTIHYHRGTLTAAPNFALELCVRQIDDAAIEGLDLSSLKLLFDGAEAVYPSTLSRFYEKFAKYGFKKEALAPAYGLAECTVGLAIPKPGDLYRVDTVSQTIFENEKKAVPVADAEKNTMSFVACGKVIPHHEMRIVDQHGAPLPDRSVGQLQFRGPSAMQGYYKNEKATQAICHDGWWDTGDYAYIDAGDLFLTGREKDIIIKGGRNFYPDTIEQAIKQLENASNGTVVAFGITDAKLGTEKLIIAAEIESQDEQIRREAIAQIMRQTANAVGIPVDEVVLMKPHTIPKTASGKVRRAECKQLYLSKKLNAKHAPVWWQLAKLVLGSKLKKISHLFQTGLKALHGLYIILLLAVWSPFLYLFAWILPTAWLRKVFKVVTRITFFLSGYPIKVHGIEKLQQSKPVIFVANHASYIDPALLLAILPTNTTFVGKKELSGIPIARTVMKYLKYLTVDREDFAQSQTDVEKMIVRLKAGENIALFPEGTFLYATGLRQFKSGAFKMAITADVAVCPISLSGTRKMLRDNSWLPNLTALEITIGELIAPQNAEWDEMMRLRRESYEFIAQYCGEQKIV